MNASQALEVMKKGEQVYDGIFYFWIFEGRINISCGDFDCCFGEYSDAEFLEEKKNDKFMEV